MKDWLVQETAFSKEHVELNGSKFLLANGYMGYRGTLEEFEADQLVACNMAGLFDRYGDGWREPVNAPNPLYTVVWVDGEPLHCLTGNVVSHTQTLDIKRAVHIRETVFQTSRGTVTVRAERFVSMAEVTLMGMRYTVTPESDMQLTIETGIDGRIWDINGPHIEQMEAGMTDGVLTLTGVTHELHTPIVAVESVCCDAPMTQRTGEKTNLRSFTVDVKAGAAFSFTKVAGVYWGAQAADAVKTHIGAVSAGYEALLAAHEAAWADIWRASDVVIEGDAEAQKALRYSIYHLSAIAPRHSDKCNIPARGLSGQVYKGAAFWDTEMFMLPFFCLTNPDVARNLIRYRLHTIGGAERKAAEYGYEGAFYAWESQETGDDACTLFNVTDIFTNRPMRTYFRDRQIHVSADVVYGIWTYYKTTGDDSIFPNGAARVVYECARFFYTYSYYKAHKGRYELLNVVGPDEYHERVDNNAFTNVMVKNTLHTLVVVLDILREKYPDFYRELIGEDDLAWVHELDEKLYVPQPDEKGIIEQFDGYHKLEDISLEALKARMLNPNEYLGGGNGLATTTRILKQADVIMLLNVFRDQYSAAVKKANWDYYEPYTEHGSSLSACAYATIAADIGYTDFAYRYFMKTATVDLTGNTKQYIGPMYIGGTHPAANGGAWSTAIFGLAGVTCDMHALTIDPRLPEHWEGMRFALTWKGALLRVDIARDAVTVTLERGTLPDEKVTVCGKSVVLKAGEPASVAWS